MLTIQINRLALKLKRSLKRDDRIVDRKSFKF